MNIMFYIKEFVTGTIVAIYSIEPDDKRKGWLRGIVVDPGNDHKSYVGANRGISADHVFNSGLYEYSKEPFGLQVNVYDLLNEI